MEPLLLNRAEAAKILGISSRFLFTLAKRGEVRFRKLGRRRMFFVEELRRFAAGRRSRRQRG